jgi:hypothetical protein
MIPHPTRPSSGGHSNACVWPSQTHRHDQLDRAIRITQHVNPTMATADATNITEHIAALPAGAATVVVSSWTLAYLSEHDRTDVLDQLRVLSVGRTISLVCLEGDGIVSGITSSIEPIGSHPLVISVTTFFDGERSDRTLGALGAQGDWITLIENDHLQHDRHSITSEQNPTHHGTWPLGNGPSSAPGNRCDRADVLSEEREPGSGVSFQAEDGHQRVIDPPHLLGCQ